MKKYIGGYFAVEVPDNFSGNMKDVLKLLIKIWKKRKTDAKIEIQTEASKSPIFENVEINPFLYYFWKDFLERENQLLFYMDGFDESLVPELDEKIKKVGTDIVREEQKNRMRINLEKLLQQEQGNSSEK